MRSWLAGAVLLAAPATRRAAQTCLPDTTDPRAALQSAAALIGWTAARQAGRVLALSDTRVTLQPYQSDRTYPPFFALVTNTDRWFSPALATERSVGRGGAYPGLAFPSSPVATLAGPHASWSLRDSLARPAADHYQSLIDRPLDPWAVLADFLEEPAPQVMGRCEWRDYPRLTISRAGPFGEERLLLDAKTSVPVGLIRKEPHYLWGQVRVDYVWSNWSLADSAWYPFTAFRVVDGAPEVSVTTTRVALARGDSAPTLSPPDRTLRLPELSGAFYRPAEPDTERVGTSVALLDNRRYRTGAVLLGDTVYLLDATLSEARARQDSARVAALFPGPHPVVLVVTDLAWPHIGGLRFWVASGATVVAHEAARAFLQRVVERSWTLSPDKLETTRPRAALRLVGVRDSLALGGGGLRLHAIDGVSSEVALLAWVPGERFLWPGDYVQDLTAPSGYAVEVVRAAGRAGIVPERFAAQHVGLTPWRRLVDLNAPYLAGPARN